ncbi:hypothetical protein ACYCVF_33630 [Bradyrhizobium sp. 1.29L]
MLWQADLVQAVIFSQPGVPQPDALSLWMELFGSESPDSFNRLAQNPAAQTTAAGVRDGVNVTVASQIGRIDVLMQSPDSVVNVTPVESPPSTEIPVLEDFGKSVKQVSGYAAKLSTKVRPVRLAIVLSLLAKTEGNATSIITEASEASFPREASDAIYQFNVRDSLKCVPSVMINRICTWSQSQMQLLRFNVAQSGATPQLFQAVDAVSWKIDLNTLQTSTFDPAQAPEILSELADSIISISALGRKAFE